MNEERITSRRDGHWLVFNRDREVTGCHCGFEADSDSDCGWGDSVVDHIWNTARADAAEKARQEADAVKDREFGNLRWMDGHAQGLKDGRAEALAPVLALADEWEAERDAPFGEAHMSYGYAQHELRRAVASHQEGGAVVSRDGEVCCSNPASCSGIAGPGTEGCVRDQEGGA